MSDWYPGNPKPSTPEERSVLVWLVILGLTGVGLWAIYAGMRASPSQATTGSMLVRIGLSLVGIAVATYLVQRVIRRWTE
jgi:hypothetical protein